LNRASKFDLALLDRYEEIEFAEGPIATGYGLSGWQCENPFARDLVADVARDLESTNRVLYAYSENDENLQAAISKFHESADGTAPAGIVPGAGANALLFSFGAYLKSIDVRQVYYLPPLYFALEYALALFGIVARPISGRHALEDDFRFNLPAKKTYLLLADPIWYAGVPVPESVFSAIGKWQSDTGSLVFVDGSFQYMRWDGQRAENSSHLDPTLTVRVICPTKSLAIHGYRFAYALLPAGLLRPLAKAHNFIFGSTTTENVVFARHAIVALSDGRLTQAVTSLVRDRHEMLRDKGLIASKLQPSCGYFVFEDLLCEIKSRSALMDGSYFHQTHFPGYVRLNLLSPSISALFPKHSD
jgi:aspartate/methionine/tyrosine aminotransferase